MFKPLVIASTVVALSLSSISASATQYHHHHHHHYYKDQPIVYKDMPAAPTCGSNFPSGPYVGVSIGNRTNTTSDPAVYRGVEGTISLGYADVMMPSFYLGGEVFVGNNVQIKDYRTFTNDSVKTTWNYGISIMPGVIINDAVVGYLRGGIQRARFNNENTSANGWHIGVGSQTNLNSFIDIRAEYIFSLYQHIATNLDRPQVDQFNIGLIFKFL